MKKIFIFLVLTLPFVYTSLGFANFKVPVNSTETIIVPDHFTTIQEAINSAKEGQKIFVRSGMYLEYLTIDKPVFIYGENREKTIIVGNGSRILLRIYSDNVNISGLWLRNASTAIYLKRVKNCRIFQNKITDIKFGVYTGKSSGTAIYLDKTDRTIIEENFATDIYYTHVLLEGSNHNKISNNIFIANTRWSQALLLRNSHNNIIEWNKVYGTSRINEGGIGIMYSSGNIIQFNDIKQNDWCGISLRASNRTIIKGNNITGHQILFGLYLKRTENTTIYCNNFEDNIKDIAVDEAKNTTWVFNGLGNYWDRYKGFDKDHDGVGDSIYSFSGQNDTCPLMGRFYPFKLSLGSDTKSLEVISNSTIWLNSSQISDQRIVLKSKGQFGDYVFCLIKTPNRLNLRVTVSGREPLMFKNIVKNQDFTLLYILYVHEKPEEIIVIIPEATSFTLQISGLILIIITIFAVLTFMYRKGRNKNI
jgi:nitrous oxidase accessory protein